MSIGRTLFVHAAHVGSLEVFEELAKGVSKDDLRFALFGAAVGGKLDILKWLWSEVAVVAAGVRSSERVKQVWWKAARYGHLHILEFLGGDEVGDMHWFKDCSQAMDTHDGRSTRRPRRGIKVDTQQSWSTRSTGMARGTGAYYPSPSQSRHTRRKTGGGAFYLGDVWTGGARTWLAVAPDAGVYRDGRRKCDYDMLRWLLKEGCPFDSFTLELFATSGKYDALDVQRLKWAQEQGLQLSEPVMEAAIVRNDLASARWLHENGCPISDAAVYLALRHTRCADGMLQFLVEECGALFDSNEITCRDAIQDR